MNIYYQIDKEIKYKKPEDVLLQPVIVRVNEFTEESVKKFDEEINKALATGQDFIPVIVDSYGGQVYALLSMIDIIKALPIPIYTIASGKVMSCGSILFAMGAKGHRYFGPKATMMIHEVASCVCGKNNEIQADAKEVKRLNHLIMEMVSEYCGHEKDFIEKRIHKKGHADWYLTADEVKTNGFCDFIGTPRIKVSVKYDCSLELLSSK